MSLANLHFFWIFNYVSHPLYICKNNLQAAMDKEDCGPIAVIHNSQDICMALANLKPLHSYPSNS